MQQRPAPAAGVTRLLSRDLDVGFGTLGGFFERDLEVVPKIGAALLAAPPPAAVAEAENVAEPTEDVFEAGEDRRGESAGRGAAEACMAEPVVDMPLVGVGQHAVRFGGRLELFLGVPVSRIAIRVVLQRQLAVRALDRLIVGSLRDTEDLVVVALTHPWRPLPSKPAEAVRRSCSRFETPP